ncbi:MAG: SNF2-related protein [Chloroflexota bacterium]|nr:SNF2-related protein [Chloroflexota bacterium]
MSAIRGGVDKFGGLKRVAEALGYPYSSRQTWAEVEDLRPHLDPLVGELRRMPTQRELKRLGRDDLNNAIHKLGGFRHVSSVLGYPHKARRAWPDVEALRNDLDSHVAQLGRMPTGHELAELGRHDLANAIRKFGGPAKVAEVLGYPYDFGPALERRERLRLLEQALEELDRSQRLLPGQVILILRLAGLLSWSNVRETLQHLQALAGSSDPVLDAQLARLAAAEPDFETDDDVVDDRPDAGGQYASGDQIDDSHDTNLSLLVGPPTREAVDGPEPVTGLALPGRSKEAERAELRGWSALGGLGLVDVSDSLVRLCVARLKTVFYGFANEQRGSLEAPAVPATESQVADLAAHLQQAAFGEYGDLLDNELIRAATHTYVADLVGALLLPRREVRGYTPRLYQLDGARFVTERVHASDRPFGLLFDQPGMGKTLTALWGLAAAEAERVVIVAPLTVKREVWKPGTIRLAFHDLPDDRFAADLDGALALPPEGPAVAVLHYEELRRHDAIQRLAAPRRDNSPPFDVLVFDEAHEVKERLSTASERGETREGGWFLRAGARSCVGLTATPVVNELYEPVSLLHLAQGRRDTNAARRLRTRRLRDRVDVMEYLLADSLRRLKQDVLFEIPPREERVHRIAADSGQLDEIPAFLAKGRRHVTARLSEYRRLMLETKLDWVASAVRTNLVAITPDGLPDPKTVVLCYNVEGISDRVRDRLAGEIGADRVAYVSGTTPPEEREGALRRFREPATASAGVAVLVGTVGTVGVGVTLFDPEQPITPHRVIFADLPYTWAEFEQGVDRVHRVGQRLPVTVDVPVVGFGDQLVRADGEPLPSFDEWVWDALLAPKRRLADQVLDAAFDVSAYSDLAIRKAIRTVLEAADEAGGVVVLPPPPADSPAAEHRRAVGRLRGMPRERAAEAFREEGASERFLAANDASPSTRLAQRLVRERLGRWLDRRSVVVDLGCGSNPLRDLPVERVIGIDRHNVNGGLVGDSAATGLPSGEADFVVMSLSMWGTPPDRLAYLGEAKRLLRPLGKLVIVEPTGSFGGPEWKAGVAKLAVVLQRLGMRLAEVREYAVDEGASVLAFVIDNSSTPAADDLGPGACDWAA